MHSVKPKSLSTRGQWVEVLRDVRVGKPLPMGLGLLVALVLVAHGLAQTSNQQQIQLHVQRAEEALKEHHPQDALNEFREILKIDPGNAEAYANLGQIEYVQRDYADAAKEFTQALKLKPQLWDAEAFLGLSDMMSGHTNEGDRLLLEVFPRITNQSLKVEAGVSLVRFHMATHSLEKVVSVVDQLEQSSQNDPEVLYVAYRAYSGLAANALSSLYHTWPDSARVHQIFAQAAVTQDDFPGAIKQYRMAIEADPHLPGIHYELGRTILTNSQDNAALSQAEKEFKTELSTNSWDADSEFELGEVYRLQANPEAAEEHYRRALHINPELGLAQTGLGDLLVNKNKPAEAIPYLEAGARLDPDDETAHYKLSRAYAAVERQDDAKREMDIFLKLRKEHATESPRPSPDAPGAPIK